MCLHFLSKPFILFIILYVLLYNGSGIHAQKALIKESSQTIKTYPYSDPNPVPAMAINRTVSRFYPYYMFDGYTDKGTMQNWKVVTLENPYINVSVLPEVGGKVYGAIEKSTGQEFVYLNQVLKFRAIGIRGPWTSGGIEHNFGLDLGHAPWAAGPVDYVLKENKDGSVSCIVGGLDLASRSEWRVNIRLPKDKAYFETESLWYNPLPLHQAYLSWENAAFKATDDLQFYFPGTHHIDHDGSAYPWPIDNQGRNLAFYKNNNFGGSKSYHVVGQYPNWFGGYWHNNRFGFGHWAPYADAPGKKLWIWTLSREGAIWEDLLTDTDGQYIEAQSGVMLNQAAERSGYHSPFTQLAHRPFYPEVKKELWFPVKQTGGMSDASPYGTLYLVTTGDSLKISINPTAALNDSLVVSVNNMPVYKTLLQLQPMQVYRHTLPLQDKEKDAINVHIGGTKWMYTTDSNATKLDRPVATPDSLQDYDAPGRLFQMAEEQNSMRNYEQALRLYQECLKKDPRHSEALTRLAELHYRKAQYTEGLAYARRVLDYHTYHGGANFMYGVLQQKLGNGPKAEEAFSIASQTMEYRSAAYLQIAGLRLQQNDFQNAIVYAKRALEYNRNNLTAYQYLGTAYRKLRNVPEATTAWNTLLEIDPLNHRARFEQYLLQPTAENLKAFNAGIKNELPHETYLELAIAYANLQLNNEAIQVLEQAPPYPTVYYWLAYLYRGDAEKRAGYLKKAESLSPRLVFPFRLEEIPVLTWAGAQQPSWKTAYYLGMVYWNNGQPEKAKALFEQCGNTPDYAPFYLARGVLFGNDVSKQSTVLPDFQRAVKLEPIEWRTWHYLSAHYLSTGNFDQALNFAKQAYGRFPKNPVAALNYSKALLHTARYEECLKTLKNTLILPQEGAREGHDIFEMASLALAVQKMQQKKYTQALVYLDSSRAWPENLGAGKPYDPDNRLQDFMAAYCERALGRPEKAAAYDEAIKTFSRNGENWTRTYKPAANYIGGLVLKKGGSEAEANRLLARWKQEQDSLHNWKIMPGSAAPEVRWVLAKWADDTQMASALEKDLLAGQAPTSFRMLYQALEWINRKEN